MEVKGKDKKIALAYIKSKYPVGLEIYDRTRSGSFIIRKNSIFEVFSDADEVAEFNPEYEYYEFLVRKPGKYSPLYYIKQTPKRLIFEYYETKILKNKNGKK